MKTHAKALFISATQKEFESKGKQVLFQRVVLMAPDDDDTISLTAPVTVDFSACKKMQAYDFILNVYKDFKGYLKAKVVSVAS
ncbi:MAG: hypothetical protein VB027_07625 [Gordonibacter sp.]|nr:hypothetical protein [Gordonibacter sp.]